MTRFHTILVDPPWPETGGGRRGAQHHYPVVPVRDMPALILGADAWRPADNAHLYLWATNTHLPDGLWLMAALGFAYKSCLTWEKPWIGLGQYFRGQTEHILFGIRGNGLQLRRAHTPRRDLTTLIRRSAFRLAKGERVHSRKPPESYERIEAASPPPRLEMFARGEARPGWTTWGNEAAA